MARGGAVDTEARGKSVMAGHARLRKYQVKYVAGWWLARVPYGSWNRFVTWDQAALYLTNRHEAKMIDAARRAQRAREASD